MENLFVLQNSPAEEWGVVGNAAYLNPGNEEHVDLIHRKVFNRKVVAFHIPDGFITRVLKNNVTFYLTQLDLQHCTVTDNEMFALCDFGCLEKMVLRDVTIAGQLSMDDMMKWMKHTNILVLDVKNMKIPNNWASKFLQNELRFEEITLKNLSQHLNIAAFQQFLQVSFFLSIRKKGNQLINIYFFLELHYSQQ